jgi:hypothetical protein
MNGFLNAQHKEANYRTQNNQKKSRLCIDMYG